MAYCGSNDSEGYKFAEGDVFQPRMMRGFADLDPLLILAVLIRPGDD